MPVSPLDSGAPKRRVTSTDPAPAECGVDPPPRPNYPSVGGRPGPAPSGRRRRFRSARNVSSPLPVASPSSGVDVASSGCRRWRARASASCRADRSRGSLALPRTGARALHRRARTNFPGADRQSRLPLPTRCPPADTVDPANRRPLSRFLRRAWRATDTGFYLRTASTSARSTGSGKPPVEGPP